MIQEVGDRQVLVTILARLKGKRPLRGASGTSTPAPSENPSQITLPTSESQLGHIFRDETGHLPDTPNNRSLLQSVANDSGNKLGSDQFGNEWYAQTQPNGSQVWVKVRNGQIENGGLNQTPKTYSPSTGLSAPVKPSPGK
jgi:filamentous hemagglutinin